MFKTMKLIEF